MESISLKDVAGSGDTPDVSGSSSCALISSNTTDGDKCKTAINKTPFMPNPIIDFFVAVDAPDVLIVCAADTDLLEFTWNVIPCRYVLRILAKLTVKDIVVAVDSPDTTMVGYRDVLHLTFNSNQWVFLYGLYFSS